MSKKKPVKKLSNKVREEIKSNYSKLRLKDYEGEALAYLKQVRGAAKGRKARKDKVAKIDDLVIPRDSELYRLIERGAKAGASKDMEWYGAFGLLVTLVWLYLEILRLLARLRSR